MNARRNLEVWLREGPSLDELKAAYPKIWDSVEQELASMAADADYERLISLTAAAARPGALTVGSKRQQEEALLAEVRRQMVVIALRQHRASVATGISEGKVRFNLVNGWLLQHLFFVRKLERKPVSMFWFRLIWPIAWQRSYLMTLVQPKGIYCFYSKPLVSELAKLIGDAPALEIAAGDGTLSHFLTAQGVDIVPTDDYSWSSRIEYPEWVKRQDAHTALRSRQPKVVICSWPPAGNKFEREVFRTRSVEIYIMIGSRHEWATGNWPAYRAAREFEIAEAAALSKLVLPPELDCAVYVFRRHRQ